MPVGSVVVSVDAELGWGHHDIPDPPMDRTEGARAGWSHLVDLFDRYEVPATWAVVGHLFLDDCDGVHADHPAPTGWFARERGEWQSRPDLRFGRGLVEDLQDADADHDVGCHTFSHVEFGDPDTSRELAAAEVRESLAAARDRDLEMRSFVFPRNNVGHRSVLAAAPLICYRGVSPVSPQGRLRPLRKLSRAVRGYPLLVEPTMDDHGLVNVPASLYLFGFEGLLRSAAERVVGDPVVRQARYGIEQAARGDGVFHVYLHPNDLTDPRDRRRVESILSAIAARRADTGLSVETMRGVAERLLESQGKRPVAPGGQP
jgi:peptidoglycan/xylan/chitin deacetylase (PgdA/CDA1 family)